MNEIHCPRVVFTNACITGIQAQTFDLFAEESWALKRLVEVNMPGI